MSNSFGSNPYAVTTDALAAPGYGTDVEAMRKRHLNHEASVKSIGTLYMLGAVICGIAAIFYVFAFFSLLNNPNQTAPAAGMLVGSVVAIGIAALYAFVARGLWRLQPWSRIVATIISVIGLIGFPIGTIISAYFIYLLQSPKGAVVFSDEYKHVIQATPHIKYKTSFFVWVLLAILLLLIIGGIVAFVANSSPR
jgi:MFS family permease